LAALSGACAGLAVAAKQPNVAFGLFLLAYAAWSPRLRLAPYAIAFVLGAGIPLMMVYAQSGEWARFYLLDLPRQHGFDERHIGNFWTSNVLPRFTLPLVIGPLFLIARALARQWRTAIFYFGSTIVLVSIAWVGWANRDSNVNVYEPAFASLSILFGLGIAAAVSLLNQPAFGPRLMRFYIVGLAIAQFAILGYNPRATIPPRSDIWAGDRLTATISTLPGRVYAPQFGEWSIRAGKGPQPTVSGAMELAGSFGGQSLPPGRSWFTELNTALTQREYDYVLWQPQSDAFALQSVIEAAGYINMGPLFPSDDVFNQWKSSITPDIEVYVPRERASDYQAKRGS
jgi:hypothetical protein